jgi:hypothetical protein
MRSDIVPGIVLPDYEPNSTNPTRNDLGQHVIVYMNV